MDVGENSAISRVWWCNWTFWRVSLSSFILVYTQHYIQSVLLLWYGLQLLCGTTSRQHHHQTKKENRALVYTILQLLVQSTTYVCTRRHDALAVPTTAMSSYYVTLTDYESEVCCCESCAWFCASVKANIRGVYEREKRLGEKNTKFPQCHTHI